MSILVVGSVAYDTVITPAARAEKALGGSAMYFSAAASFFAPVRVVGIVGMDYEHDKIRFLRERDVDLTGLETVDGKTFHWVGEYTLDWNNAITHDTQLNVFETFSPKIPAGFRQSEYVFLANIHPALQLEVLQQIEKPILTAMDTMNFWIDGARDALLKVIEKVDILFLNDAETRQLSGKKNLLDAADFIFNLGPKTLIIKKGEYGALLLHNSELFALPAFPLRHITDPTGAGDSFAGGFMGYLARHGTHDGGTLRRAVAYGSVIASYVVTDFSFDRLRTLTRAEIEQRYQELHGLVSF